MQTIIRVALRYQDNASTKTTDKKIFMGTVTGIPAGTNQGNFI